MREMMDLNSMLSFPDWVRTLAACKPYRKLHGPIWANSSCGTKKTLVVENLATAVSINSNRLELFKLRLLVECHY